MSVPIELPLQNRFRWPLLLASLLFHAGAIAAFWFFTWTAFLAFIVTTILTGLFGIVLGYHRLLAHGTFTCVPWVKRCFALLGAFASQSGPISWVGIHRYHHRHPDGESDPHSPKASFVSTKGCQVIRACGS